MLLIKNKKLIVSFVLLIILILITIFAVSLAIQYINNYKPAKNSGATPEPPKQKTMEEIIDSLTAPVSGNGQKTPVSAEVLDSLTAPVKTNNDSTIDSKTNKAAELTPAPVSKEIIDSLTAPAK